MTHDDMHYVTGIPRKPMPEGRVLVHNQVWPQRRIGWNGFRAWTMPLDGSISLMVCPCDWAGVNLGGLTHYIPAGRTMGGRTDGAEYIASLSDRPD